MRLRTFLLAASSSSAFLPQIDQGWSLEPQLGNWLTAEQAQALLNAPDAATTKGLRDRPILDALLCCGLGAPRWQGLPSSTSSSRISGGASFHGDSCCPNGASAPGGQRLVPARPKLAGQHVPRRGFSCSHSGHPPGSSGIARPSNIRIKK